MNAAARWLLDRFSAAAAVVGTLLVVWNAAETYFLVTGRVVPDLEQPPLDVVVPLLFIGVIMLIGGLAVQWLLRRNNPF